MDLYSKSLSEKLHQHLKNSTIQHICRVCFTYLENSESLTSTNQQKYSLMCFYEELTSISVNLHADPTMNFCPKCVLEIEYCHKFRKKCIDADMLLKDMFMEIKYKNSGSEIVEIDRALNNNLETVVDNVLEVKQEGVIDECQVFEVEFLEESSLESDDSDKLTMFTHKKYSRRKKTTANEPNRGWPKAKKKGVLDIATYIQEQKSNKETKSNNCLVCKKFFINEKDLKIHMSLHDQNRHWVCNACNKEYKDRTTLRRHILRHMSVKPYRCDSCDKTFCELSDLKRHIRVHTGEIVEKKKCYTCKTTFPSSAALSGHRPCPSAGPARPNSGPARPSAGPARWACWCGRVLGSRRLLASHQRVHDAHKPHSCPQCHKRFRHDSTLITHLRTHTGEKPYMCSVCGKTFIQSTNLSLHMRTHTGEKPYCCKKCPMKFASGSSLKTHVLSHTEVKHKCDICGKKLAPASMVGHRRLHAQQAESRGAARRGSRRGCSLCDKTFVNAAVLREHMLVHTGEKPFECKFCPKKFPTKQRLDRHNKVKHVNKTVSEIKSKNQEHKNNKSKSIITGTDYKFVNEIRIQDLTDSEDRLEIAQVPLVRRDGSEKLVENEKGVIKSRMGLVTYEVYLPELNTEVSRHIDQMRARVGDARDNDVSHHVWDPDVVSNKETATGEAGEVRALSPPPSPPASPEPAPTSQHHSSPAFSMLTGEASSSEAQPTPLKVRSKRVRNKTISFKL